MPTVFLVDRSLSMMRPVSSEEGSPSRLELARQGVSWFFDYLSQYYPLEYTSLLTFSSSCDVVVPFTRDYETLKTKLDEVSVQDRTDLHSALCVMVDVIVNEWGSFAPCQVVVVTDGSPGVRHQDSARRSKHSFFTPFPCQISVVCLASNTEMSSPARKDSVERLCETVGISRTDVYLPNDDLCEDSVRDAVTRLVRKCFLPFTTCIKCGHLSVPVGLTPSPHMLRTNFNLSVSLDQTFPPLESSLRDLSYPSEMKVCGFIDISAIPAPPHYSRHFVLDPVKLSDSFELGKEKPKPSEEESQKASFRVLLHGGLKIESKAALLKLDDDWYGLLFSQTSTAKKSNLVLCVFHPNSDLPWLGPFPYLGPKPAAASDPRTSQAQPQATEKSFPVIPSHLPSYHSPSTMLWAKEALLQTDVSKVIRYCRKLPDKEASLVKELNKLRQVSLTFHIPELVELLCIVLGKEVASPHPTPATKKMLQQCVTFLSTNKSPTERLVVNSSKS